MTDHVRCNPSLLLRVVGNDHALFVELATIFVEDGAAKLRRLKAAALTGNQEGTRLHSHSLKSMAEQIGASTLARLAHDIERGCIDEQRACTTPQLEALDHELRATCRELQHFVTQLGSASGGDGAQ